MVPSETVKVGTSRTKAFNDPIWKIVSADPTAQTIISTPLMQRLRRVRQLGLAFLVFPGALHSRLEHSIGAMKASSLMFDELYRASQKHLPTSISDKIADHRQSICIAGLIHDCGHLAFSHVGERVLKSLFTEQFKQLNLVLDKHFPSTFLPKAGESSLSPEVEKSKSSAPAELLSVLFALSPAMQKLLTDIGLSSVEDRMLTITGFIIGRPKNLIMEDGGKKHFLSFLKCIVSGDLDADKIDYVARDAYFSGLPIPADVSRLLSQLTVVHVDKDSDTNSDIHLDQEDNSITDAYLFGLKPAGASALEMFVMTRSYLFERIYCHHKVRAAERMIERLLRQRLMLAHKEEKWDTEKILSYLLHPTGDDGVLHEMATHHLQENDDEHIRDFATQVLNREIPKRALAISRQTVWGQTKSAGKMSSDALFSWNRVLETDPQVLQREICKSIGSKDFDSLYVDWPHKNLIQENPDIVGHDEFMLKGAMKINRYFDAQQLSNAYQEVKQTGWIFAPDGKRVEFAAAAAYTLASKYDTLINREALRRAKVDTNEFNKSLDDNLEKFIASEGGNEPVARRIVSDLKSTSTSQQLIRPAMHQLKAFLSDIGTTDHEAVAMRIRSGVIASELTRDHYADYLNSMEVLSLLLNYIQAHRFTKTFDDTKGQRKEDFLQENLEQWIDSSDAGKKLKRLFSVSRHPGAANGTTDLVFKPQNGSNSIVVELKSEDANFSKMYDAHAGQPMAYQQDKEMSRVSILFCQSKGSDLGKTADSIQLRKTSSGNQIPILAICVAMMMTDKPSARGHQSVAV
uniref:HD/PDEase domain-containing protein n=1 Tax=Curvibacter symbiont subsp. Hydra magnipapillata TaxID=667019 RepID=C9YFF0_CURXX|nr:hypothetical protein Csp_D33060 [Curvibacter putative symbiont of Hydra magnipapillata]